MNNTDMLFVQKKLNDLVGCTLINLSRTADLLCLSFAPRALTTEVQEEQSLHLQCYYRLVQDGRVSLARSDYFQPSEAMWDLWRKKGLEEDVIPDDYRCDELGANRLDDRIVELNDALTGIENRFIVRTVMVDSIGDVTLCFDNGAVWSILVDTSGGEECWRYLPANEEQPQLVLYSDGIECE